MQTIFGTVELRASPATANNIGPVVTAPDGVTVRVLLRNIGPVDIVVGATPAAVAGQAIGANSNYRLPTGQSDAFVLRPRQALYAVGVGAVARVSYSASAALPIDTITG